MKTKNNMKNITKILLVSLVILSMPTLSDIVSAQATSSDNNLMSTTSTSTSSLPVISNINATSSNDGTQLIITWRTNQASDSQVSYGTSSNYTVTTPLNPALVGNHTTTITGLIPGTTYHFKVMSNNGSGVVVSSADQVITTSRSTLPAISDIKASSSEDGTAISVSWKTNQLINSRLNFGTTSNYTSSVSTSATSTAEHFVNIPGLTPNTTYHFAISSDMLGTSSDQVIRTSNSSNNGSTTSSPAISNINSSSTSSGTGITINWTTDQPATSQVRYGTSSDYTASTTINTNLTTNHSVTLSGLTPNTTYHFVVLSRNNSNMVSSSSDQMIITTTVTTNNGTSTTSSPVISNISASSTVDSRGLSISWTTDQPATSQVRYGTSSNYTASTTINTNLTTNHSVVITGLTTNTEYNFSVISRNSEGMTTTSTNQRATTSTELISNPDLQRLIEKIQEIIDLIRAIIQQRGI